MQFRGTITITVRGPFQGRVEPLWIKIGRTIGYTMVHHRGGSVVCGCVFFPFILDVKFVGCTSRGHIGGRSYRVSHPPSFCGACLYFSHEKDSAVPFPRRP